MLYLTRYKEDVMKIFIAIIILSFLYGFNTVLIAQDDPDTLRQITVEEPSQYLPDYLDNIYIGMPLADFENVKDTLSLDISENVSDMWFGITEELNEDGIDEIIYKFDKEENGINTERPLYQIDIKFLESDYEDDFVNQKFSQHWKNNETNDKEWIFKTDKDYRLIIKEIDDAVQIIATMAGTEWDPGR